MQIQVAMLVDFNQISLVEVERSALNFSRNQELYWINDKTCSGGYSGCSSYSVNTWK